MTNLVKYPRTMHLQFSPGLQNDDRMIESYNGFLGKEIVATIKMDGENTTMYSNHIHARSMDSRHHPSRDWVKKFWGERAHLIPAGWRVCGENVYAKHSIFYDNLDSYFYGFSIWDESNTSLDYDTTLMFFKDMDMLPVKELYRGKFDLKVLHSLADNLDPEKDEGFVIRTVEAIPFDEFGKKAAKWVRKGHVQTDEHWSTQAITPNRLKGQQ